MRLFLLLHTEFFHSQILKCTYFQHMQGLAFAVSSLYFMMLKSKGMDTANHPIKDDLKRIKEYVARIRKLDGGIEGIAQKKRKIAVDSVAANRMIKHELSANYDNPSSISCSDSTVHDIEESTMCNDKSFQTNDELSTQQKKKKRKKAKNR